MGISRHLRQSCVGLAWLIRCFSLAGLLTLGSAPAQRAPFVSPLAPDAPRGCFYPFQDSRGGMWLIGCETGSEGFYFFDGSHFFSLLSSPTPLIAAGSMAEDQQGGIWIAALSGIYRYFDGSLTKIADGRAFSGMLRLAPNTFLTRFQQSGQSQPKLVRITGDGEHWRLDAVVPSVPAVQFTLNRSGTILFGCPGGYCTLNRAAVLAWQPGQHLTISRYPLLGAGNTAAFHSIVWRDGQSCLWVRTTYDAAYQCPSDKRPTALPEKMLDTANPSILEAPDSTIFLTSFSKMSFGRPGKMSVITAAQGYPSTGVSMLAEDGSLWLSGAGGLSVLPLPGSHEFWTEQDGLDGNTWAITRVGETIYALAGNSIRVLSEDRQHWNLVLRLRGVGSLIAGPQGALLVGSHTEGVILISPRGRVLGRSARCDINRLVRGIDGRIWAAGERVFQVVPTGHRIALVPAEPAALFKGTVRGLAFDQHNTLWACSDAGLLHQDGAGWRAVTLPREAAGAPCSLLASDRRGDLWIADARPGGLLRIHDPGSASASFTALPANEISRTTRTNFLATDSRGWLWRGGASGTFVATPELAGRGEWIKLDRESGFAMLDANTNAFFEDRDGSVWFGEDNHIVHMQPPPHFVAADKAPSLFISAVAVDARPPALARPGMKFAPGRPLTFLLGSLQMDRRSSLRIRYRLQGQGDGWQTTRSLSVPLPRLGWGRHTLEAQAQLLDGPWSPTASLTFEVTRPAWLAWPALGGYLTAGGALAALVRRRNKRRLTRSRTLLPDLAEWRLAALSPGLSELHGTLLDNRFEVGPVLARGGFATVAQGRDLSQGGRPCAIKLFRQELMDKDWMARRFRQEVRALAGISHPNVVCIYSHGATPSGVAYLVMEFIDGRTLREVLEEGSIPLLLTASYLRQTGSALQAIHAQGICHRDLKPENLMVRRVASWGQEVVLIDFSIAIVKDPDETLHGLSRAAGTIYYMAPEQAIGFADPATDIYSLAKVLIEMLTGKRLSEMLPDASMDLPARVSELLAGLRLGLAPETIDLIAQALEFDPARRPRAAASFASRIADDLEQFAS